MNVYFSTLPSLIPEYKQDFNLLTPANISSTPVPSNAFEIAVTYIRHAQCTCLKYAYIGLSVYLSVSVSAVYVYQYICVCMCVRGHVTLYRDVGSI